MQCEYLFSFPLPILNQPASKIMVMIIQIQPASINGNENTHSLSPAFPFPFPFPLPTLNQPAPYCLINALNNSVNVLNHMFCHWYMRVMTR